MTQNEIKTGRRKTSIAQASIKKGTGNVVVNQKPVAEYFKASSRYQHTAISPLIELKAEKSYDATVKVVGGGIASQAGAVRHALARALSIESEENRAIMKKAGFLTRDPRMVERKKPGQPKARRRFQFSKR